jgi:hypothetical protein
VIGLALGSLVWAISVPLTGQREPFDGPILYYALSTFAAGVLSALPSPRHWWLALLSVYLGQHLYAFVAYPDTRAWFLFGLFVNALVPTWLFAAAGALLVHLVARWMTRRSSGP